MHANEVRQALQDAINLAIRDGKFPQAVEAVPLYKHLDKLRLLMQDGGGFVLTVEEEK